MLTQLQTPLPLDTPKGKAWAVAIIDYGPQWDLLWVTFVHSTRECWTFNNKDIREEENFTYGIRDKKKPAVASPMLPPHVQALLPKSPKENLMMRYLLILLLTFCTVFSFILGIGSARAAGGPEAATQFVDSVGKQVLGVVNGAGAKEQKQEQLKQMFSQNVDIDWMGQFVLGRAWAQANDDQRSRYLAAYRDYLLARYTTNFGDYSGSNYTITNAKAEADGEFIVGMKVKSANAERQDTSAGYRVRDGGNGFKIIDIIIEGVSLLTTERSEFNAVAQKDGVDGLIKDLQNKTAQIEKK